MSWVRERVDIKDRLGGVTSGKLVLCQQQGLLLGAALSSITEANRDL